MVASLYALVFGLLLVLVTVHRPTFDKLIRPGLVAQAEFVRWLRPSSKYGVEASVVGSRWSMAAGGGIFAVIGVAGVVSSIG